MVPAESPWRLYEEDTLSMAVYASLEHLNIQDASIVVRLTLSYS